MRPSIAALAACVAAVHAFKDTSPFIFFSSSPLPPSLQNVSLNQVQSAAAVLKTTKEFLSSCPSDVYYIIHQPSLHSTDLSPASVPNLQAALAAPTVQTRYLVSEAGALDAGVKHDLVAYLKEKCGETTFLDGDAEVQTAEELGSQIRRYSKKGKVVVLNTMEELVGDRMSGQRTTMLDKIDQSMKYGISLITGSKKSEIEGLGLSYTVIYTTTPPSGTIEEQTYEPQFQNPAHVDLKRDRRAEPSVIPWPGVDNDTRPLFEKYQFLTPGIFMGLLTGLILISILSVGMKAISSLQVSYGAFDKEMGPAAQKKQQ